MSTLAAKDIAILRGLNADTSIGHEWICDGYKYNQYYTEYKIYVLDPLKYPDFAYYNIDSASSSVGTLNISFHMNWGWEGLYDGWFPYDNWAYGQHNYSEDKKMLTR